MANNTESLNTALLKIEGAVALAGEAMYTLRRCEWVDEGVGALWRYSAALDQGGRCFGELNAFCDIIIALRDQND